MAHTDWVPLQYRLAALPSPQRQQAQAAYADAWESVASNQVTEASALHFLEKQIERLEGKAKG